MNTLPVTIGVRVVGHACGSCGHLYVASDMFEQQRMIEHEQDLAIRCCVCVTCGASGVGAGNACESCRKTQWAAMMEASTSEVRAEAQSFADAEANHDTAWTFTIEGGHTGCVYSCDGVPFYSAFARLDPTDDDPEPIAHSVTNVRREAQAVLEAVDAVCRQYDMMIEKMERVR